MRIQCVQHVHFEGPGFIAHWAESAGHLFAITHLYAGQPLPDCGQFDLLVIMGGPMGVNDEKQYNWLRPEKELIINTLKSGKKVLGVCLGAQLIAQALGAKVFANAHKEIGWYSIELTSQAQGQHPVRRIPKEINAFHWHGDTFTLPSGATHLMRSQACENQAFVFNNQALALQFHIEITPEAVAEMIENGRHELTPAPWVMTEAQLRAHTAKTITNQPYLNALLDDFCQLA